jgi:hypothetical protein
MNNAVVLIVFLFSIVLFFWGIFKTLSTQRKIYSLAFLPFLLLMLGMFLL